VPPVGQVSTPRGPVSGNDTGGSLLGPSSKLVVPAGVWLAATAAGLTLFLLLLPRRREREETASADLVSAGVMVADGPSLVPLNPVKRAPALANVPSLEDESVARWMRMSEDEAPEGKPSGPPSGTIKRRTQPRPRTTRDLQSGH
jgi:hypothetical protein